MEKKGRKEPGKPLTLLEKQLIEFLLKEKYSIRAVCGHLNRAYSTVFREIKNGGGVNAYSAFEPRGKGPANPAKKQGKSQQANRDLQIRIENIEMQVKILAETLKEMFNGNKRL